MNKILYHPKEGTTGFFYGDFPSMPMLNDRTDKWYIETGGYLDPRVWYTQKFELAKQEAINNGEILNPDFCAIELANEWYTRLRSYDDRLGKKLKDGDTFDLPDGVQVELENKECLELCSIGRCVLNECQNLDKVIRLVKEKEQPKQESQTQLWDKLIYYLQERDPNDIRVREYLESIFTIKRKEK